MTRSRPCRTAPRPARRHSRRCGGHAHHGNHERRHDHTVRPDHDGRPITATTTVTAKDLTP
ncbi:hypothetical protein ABT065_16225 [Streptomyces sp. NPDC002764]|uniref:hypothetical protein n=1 Tax=Streptomyces sp. NPDC002764 TaxID=3154428 RepID=UPI0033198FBB